MRAPHNFVRALRAAAAVVAVGAIGALAACASSSGDASDSGVSQPDGAFIHDAAPGDGDGDDENPGGGEGDRDSMIDEALDASDETTLDGEVSDGASDAGVHDDAGDVTLPALEDLPYVREVVSFSPGGSAGFGQTSYPDIVYGPPKGRGTGSGSLDVLSVGVGGEIVVGFGDFDIIDGEGADFIVFENTFVASSGATMAFIELGEVAVSEDGSTWHTFACDEAGDAEDAHEGCAGWTPTLRYDPQLVFPLDPELTGGNAFDLETVGVTRARYVRIRDLATQPGSANTGGFDLDAIGLVSYE